MRITYVFSPCFTTCPDKEARGTECRGKEIGQTTTIRVRVRPSFRPANRPRDYAAAARWFQQKVGWMAGKLNSTSRGTRGQKIAIY